MKRFTSRVYGLVFWTIFIIGSEMSYSQSIWDMVGMSRTDVIESFGQGITGNDNSLIFVGPSTEYTISSAWTLYFNARNRVKKVVFTTLHRTKTLAQMQAMSMKNAIERKDFFSIGNNKFTNGTRTVTLSFGSANGLHALYVTSY